VRRVLSPVALSWQYHRYLLQSTTETHLTWMLIQLQKSWKTSKAEIILKTEFIITKSVSIKWSYWRKTSWQKYKANCKWGKRKKATGVLRSIHCIQIWKC